MVRNAVVGKEKPLKHNVKASRNPEGKDEEIYDELGDGGGMGGRYGHRNFYVNLKT